MRYLTGFVAFILCIVGNINAAIHRCDNINDILPHLSKVTPSSMVVFDLDDTLITKTDKVLRPAGNELRTGYYFRLIQRFRFDHLLYLVSLVEQSARAELVDPSFPSIIASLQAITPNVIAHTAAPPKQMGIFDHFPEQRRQLLSTFGIDFSLAKANLPDVELTELNHIPYVCPVFHAGMLFSENYAKGEALVTLLKHYNVTPDLVIFIDDTYNNLRSAERELNKMGIPFIGIHFEEEKLFNDTVNEQITEVQYYYLVEKQQWINDEEAAAILANGDVPEYDSLTEPPSDDPMLQEDDTDEIWSF